MITADSFFQRFFSQKCKSIFNFAGKTREIQNLPTELLKWERILRPPTPPPPRVDASGSETNMHYMNPRSMVVDGIIPVDRQPTRPTLINLFIR